jgi:hypothetical protein
MISKIWIYVHGFIITDVKFFTDAKIVCLGRMYRWIKIPLP